MEHGHDDFRGTAPLPGVDVRGDAATVVLHRDGFIRMDGDGDAVAMARQGLVDGVVHDLEHHVVQAGTVVRVADVHAGPFADRIEPLQHRDAAGVVLGGDRGRGALAGEVVVCHFSIMTQRLNSEPAAA